MGLRNEEALLAKRLAEDSRVLRLFDSLRLLASGVKGCICEGRQLEHVLLRDPHHLLDGR